MAEMLLSFEVKCHDSHTSFYEMMIIFVNLITHMNGDWLILIKLFITFINISSLSIHLIVSK